MENQTLSDCGRSAESGFHDMSRQASKTESSESAADTQPLDHALDEIIQQSAEYGESEHSRSSSDTVTAEDHVAEDCENVKDTPIPSSQETGNRNSLFKNINQSRSHDKIENQSDSHDNDSAVFEMSTEERRVVKEKSRPKTLKPQNSYDRDFPATLTVNYMTKDKTQTFQNKQTKMSVSDIEDNDKTLPSNAQLPSNSSATPLPSNTEGDISLPSNTDSVQMDNKHPGDADIYSDACQASHHDHVPNSDSNATHIVPDTDAHKDNLPVTESKISDDTLHIGNQTLSKPHTSATVCDSETETICEPKVVNDLEPLVTSSSIDISDKTDINSEATTNLSCDSNDNCDKTKSADDPQPCDDSLERVGVNTDNAGADSIERTGIESTIGAGIDAESQGDSEVVDAGTCIEGASGFEDSLGASGIPSDTENSAQGDTTSI